jgi:hypothetical protein
MIDKETKDTIIEALEIGLYSAMDEASQYHLSHAGYRQYRHDALDNDVKKIEEALKLIKEL